MTPQRRCKPLWLNSATPVAKAAQIAKAAAHQRRGITGGASHRAHRPGSVSPAGAALSQMAIDDPPPERF